MLWVWVWVKAKRRLYGFYLKAFRLCYQNLEILGKILLIKHFISRVNLARKIKDKFISDVLKVGQLRIPESQRRLNGRARS